MTSPRQPRRWAEPRSVGVVLAIVATVVAGVTFMSLPRGASLTSGVASSPVTTPSQAPVTPSLASTQPAASPKMTLGRPGTVAVRIAMPRLGIDLPIVEGDGMVAPMGKAAHFPGSAWPDAGSNTYLYGHAQERMFVRLWDAKVGDEIRLTLANSQKRCFAVSEVIASVAWNDINYLLPTDGERLTLQTSTSYLPTAPRFVVIALPCR